MPQAEEDNDPSSGLLEKFSLIQGEEAEDTKGAEDSEEGISKLAQEESDPLDSIIGFFKFFLRDIDQIF